MCLDDSKTCLSLPKPFRINLKFIENLLEIFDPYLFAKSVCQIRSSNGTSIFNPPLPGKLNTSWAILSRGRHGFPQKIARLKRKKERKTVYQKLKCTDINVTLGRKKVKVLESKDLLWAENGIFGNPRSPQKPQFLPFQASSQGPARAAHTAILSLSIGTYI